jgi:4-diphosphocytidyl-2-C-methyl-D-erythritol kinase
VLASIDRADILDIALAPKPRLEVNPEDLPAGQRLAADRDNLVWRAAEALGGPDRGWRISLYKTIPVGAGLGGGSADAAVTLQALANLWRSPSELAPLALALGSDVPYFLQGGLCRARGRGELVEPLEAPPTLHVVVAAPASPVATAEAYQWLDEAAERPQRPIAPFLAALGSGDPRTIARAMWNDFEPVVLRRHPAIAALRERLLAMGAFGALLCGSGSAVFGVFATPDEANAVASALRQEGTWAVYAPTASRATELGRDPLAAPEFGPTA